MNRRFCAALFAAFALALVPPSSELRAADAPAAIVARIGALVPARVVDSAEPNEAARD